MRVDLILDLLPDNRGGRVLDAGCGPGVLARALLRSPRHDVNVTVLDRSPTMVKYCLDNVDNDDRFGASIGDLEALPFADSTFDITFATGALEYLNIRNAIKELSRVTRPGGTVIASMLNPLNPYRLGQWFLYWPMVRALGGVEHAIGVPHGRRHGAALTGIRALRPALLRRCMQQADLVDPKVTFFDPTVLIPPFDRHKVLNRVDELMTKAITRPSLMPWLSKGYLVSARRA
jgi:SAM-dependent methyltransferase